MMLFHGIMLKDLLKHKLWVISSAALLVIPLYTWRKLFKTYREDKRNYEKEVLFYRRHNCVVMYSPKKGMSGWPPHSTRFKAGKDGIGILLEPIIYFINTAKESLDVAVMILNCDGILNALFEANKRGVKIRVLLNFESVQNNVQIFRKLMKEGVDIRYYIPNITMSSMMHYKYMLKDYNDLGGYVFMGSMNMGKSSFLNNFEDIVFTTTEYVVEAIHENFEECWDYIGVENKNDYSKSILLKSNLLY